MAADNKALGRFDLTGIPPAQRGVPQIEVTFDIDANGIVNVSAKDMATSKQQQITVSGSGNLSDEEIERMQKEAESHAEDDKKKLEEIDVINSADAFVYSTENSIKDMEGKVDEKNLKVLKDGAAEIKKMLGEENKDVPTIKTKLEELNKVAQQAATELYQKAAAEQQKTQGAGPASAADAESEGDAGKKKEKVVDAEFTSDDEKSAKKA